MALTRSDARPGERWIEAKLTLHARHDSLPELRVAAAIFALGEDKPAATLTATPTLDAGHAPRPTCARSRLKTGRLRVELLEGEPAAFRVGVDADGAGPGDALGRRDANPGDRGRARRRGRAGLSGHVRRALPGRRACGTWRRCAWSTAPGARSRRRKKSPAAGRRTGPSAGCVSTRW